MSEQIRTVAWATMLTLVVVAVCSGVDNLVGGDAMAPLEVGAALIFGMWTATVARAIIGSARLGGELLKRTYSLTLHGVPCRVIRGGRSAFVLGTLRPQIYVGEVLLVQLSEDELRGVIAHEDHHRRTGAPLRSAALQAWLRLLSWSTVASAVVGSRLIDLERAADTHAMRSGVPRRALAAALLRVDTVGSPIGSNFSSHADQRVAALLFSPADKPSTVALEWLPWAVAAAAAVLCHVAVWTATH